jgi:hypothetical protein
VLALRRSSITHGSIAMLLLGLALLTRMGSMLTVPAFGLWMVWAARQTRRGVVAAGGATLLALVACTGLVWTLGWLYGSGTGMPGSNSAYLLCGVAHGGNYGDCEALYAAELANKTEADRARFLCRKAWEAAVRQPRRALARLRGVNSFTSRTSSTGPFLATSACRRHVGFRFGFGSWQLSQESVGHCYIAGNERSRRSGC